MKMAGISILLFFVIYFKDQNPNKFKISMRSYNQDIYEIHLPGIHWYLLLNFQEGYFMGI